MNHCPLCPPPPSGKWNVWALKWENPPWSSRNPSGVSGSWQRSLLWSSLFMSSPGHRTHVSHSFPGPGKTQFTTYAHYTIINRTTDPVIEVQQKMLQHDCQGSLFFPFWYSETSSECMKEILHILQPVSVSLQAKEVAWTCHSSNFTFNYVSIEIAVGRTWRERRWSSKTQLMRSNHRIAL